MEEDEALRNYCRRMISLIRSKRQHLGSSEWDRGTHKNQGTGRRENTECERQVVVGDELRDLRATERDGDQTSLSLKPRRGPEAQPVPAQLISMLRLKTFEEDMRRVRRHVWLIWVVTAIVKKPRFSVSYFHVLFIFNVRLPRRSSTIPPSAACVSRNRLLWPWKVLSGGRRHNFSSKLWRAD